MNVCLNNALGNHNDNITCVVFVELLLLLLHLSVCGGGWRNMERGCVPDNNNNHVIKQG